MAISTPATRITWDNTRDAFVESYGAPKASKETVPVADREAEWEYACGPARRVSTVSATMTRKPDNYAWFKKNAEDVGEPSHPVGENLANTWGLPRHAPRCVGVVSGCVRGKAARRARSGS